MNKSYKNLINILIAGIMIFSFIFATESLNKNRISKSIINLKGIDNNSNNENESRDACSDSFTVLGSNPEAGDCWSDGSGYFWLQWEGGCLAMEMTWSEGTLDISSYEFTEGFYFSAFDPGVTETFEILFDSGSVGVGEATNDCTTCEDLGQIECWDGSCADSLDDCPEEGSCADGEIIDCVDDTECWVDTWVGDGYCDGTSEQYGANLCCYDNDGGDCTEAECADAPEPGECVGGSYELVVGGGSWDSEITWELSDGSSGAVGNFDLELSNGDYTFTGYDSYGDGWNGAYAVLTSSDGCQAMNFTLSSGSQGSYDFTLGEAVSCEDQGLITCPDGSCAETLDDCPDPTLDSPTNFTATAGDSDISLSWSAPGGGGGGDGFIPCADGSMEYQDCLGTCFNNEDCANDTYDGCVEGETTWLGDTYCDNGDWGLDFQCDEYGNDCGDCGPLDDPLGVCDGSGGGSNCEDGQTECWDGSCVDDPADCPTADCVGTFTVSGFDPEVGDCWADGSAYFWLSWDGGCVATNLNYSEGDLDLTGYGFNGTIYFYGMDPSVTETFVITFENGDTAADEATSNDCDGGGGGGDGTCVDACGGASADGSCYCDELCEGYGDCCADACEECGYDCGRSEDEQTLYDLYHDEFGNRITNTEVNHFVKPIILNYNDHSIVKSFNNDITRDLTGYNVYRDGSLLDNTTETMFSDASAMAGTEYCYYVTAVYDEGESGSSNTDCAMIETTVTPGDVNNDGAINVLDIVIMANFILGAEIPDADQLAASDVNGDGVVNVLDIVIIVNWILGGDRASINTTDDATIVLNNNSFEITTKTGIGGVQIMVSGDYSITNSSNYDYYENNGTILIFSLEGKDITGELFTFTGDLVIEDIIVANSNGEEITADVLNTVSGYRLSSAYPNPFNPSTTINYTIAKDIYVSIAVYDVIGRKIESLINGHVDAGNYEITWNGANYSSGIYYVKMKAGSYQNTQKLLLMK